MKMKEITSQEVLDACTKCAAASHERQAMTSLTPERRLLREAQRELQERCNRWARLADTARSNEAAECRAIIDALLALPATAASFEAIRDAIAVRMGGHTISERDGEAWGTFMFLLRAVKASECAVSETAPSGTAKVPEGWKLVPIKPTQIMLENAWAAVWTQTTGESDHDVERNEHAAKWEAMLAAAPTPDGNEDKVHK